jgi:hypothetical protein
VKISVIIAQSIIQRNITKICATYYYMKPIVFRFCEGVLNYSHFRTPRARPHERTDTSKRP